MNSQRWQLFHGVFFCSSCEYSRYQFLALRFWFTVILSLSFSRTFFYSTFSFYFGSFVHWRSSFFRWSNLNTFSFSLGASSFNHLSHSPAIDLFPAFVHYIHSGQPTIASFIRAIRFVLIVILLDSISLRNVRSVQTLLLILVNAGCSSAVRYKWWRCVCMHYLTHK